MRRTCSTISGTDIAYAVSCFEATARTKVSPRTCLRYQPTLPAYAPSLRARYAVHGTGITLPGTNIASPGTDLALPGTDSAVPGTDRVVPGTDTAYGATQCYLFHATCAEERQH
eukprot:2365066-Rhodomonas_salina.1